MGHIVLNKEELKNSTCCFTARRPDMLYGYDINTLDYNRLKNVIKIECINLIETKGVNRFISGGALGGDTIAYIVIHNLKKRYNYNIKNILAIPFENQYINWINKVDIDRYNEMKEFADEIIYVDLLNDYRVRGTYNNKYHYKKMEKRNRYMCDNSRYMIAIWEGEETRGTWNCIKYGKKINNEIIIINPKNLKVNII